LRSITLTLKVVTDWQPHEAADIVRQQLAPYFTRVDVVEGEPTDTAIANPSPKAILYSEPEYRTRGIAVPTPSEITIERYAFPWAERLDVGDQLWVEGRSGDYIVYGCRCPVIRADELTLTLQVPQEAIRRAP
jgi:hypothetical protein